MRIILAGLQIQVRAQLDYFDFDGKALGDATILEPDHVVEVRRAFPPGPMTVTMDGSDCLGSVNVLADHEIDVLAYIQWFEDPRCVLQSVGVHPPSEAHTGARGQIIVEAEPGADVRVEALDVPDAQPFKGPPDVAGYVTFVELAAGWYEVSLRDEDKVVFRTPVEIGVDGIGQVDIVVPPPVVPLKCIEIEQRPCEAAMLEAWSFGLFPSIHDPGKISRVTVGPAASRTCGSEAGSVNELDVTFERVHDTTNVISMTRSPSGFLHVCPAF